MCLVMLSFLSTYISFLFHPLLIASLNLILFVQIPFLRILIVIPLPMFNQFVLITLQVLILCSLAHLKLHSHLQPLKLHLRLWIHLYVSPSIFVSPQSYWILLILVILYHLFSFQLLFIVSLGPFSIKRQFLICFSSKPWMRNFLLCIRRILGIWFLYLLIRVLLVVVDCIR